MSKASGVIGNDPRAASVQIYGSPAKLAGLILAGAAMALLSLAIGIRLIPVQQGSFQQFVGYSGFLFFALCTMIGAWRLVALRGPVITIDHLGIQDIRLAEKVIPWSEVRSISTWQYSRQKAMLLAVDPALEHGLNLTRIAR